MWRLVLLKFLVVLFWTVPISLPLLPAAAQPAAQSDEPAQTKMLTTAGPDIGSTTPRLWASDAGATGLATYVPLLLATLLAGWLIAVGLQGSRLVRGWLTVRRFQRSCRPAARDGLGEHLRTLCQAYAIRREPLLLEHGGGGSPMLLGIFHPAIVVPRGLLAGLSLAERGMMLEHELAHVRRRDLAWCLAAAVVRTVFFFHPFAWWASRRLELAQEIAADQFVLTSFRKEVGVYAKMLLAVANQPQPIGLVPSLSVGTVGHYETLKRRFVAMKSFHLASRRVAAASVLLVGLIAILGVVPWRLVAAEAHSPAANDPGSRSAAAKLSPAQKRIIEALQKPTTMRFVNTPLKEVFASLEKRHKIPIQFDKEAFVDAGIPPDTQMTRELGGLSLHSALRVLLGDLNLTHVVKQDVLWITTVDEAQRLLQKDAIDPATYWKSSQVAAASRKKLAEALKKPIQVEFNRAPLWDVIPSLRKVSGVEIHPDLRSLDYAGLWDAHQGGVRITLQLKDVPLESVLTQLVRNAGLRYVVDDDFILITSPKEEKP